MAVLSVAMIYDILLARMNSWGGLDPSSAGVMAVLFVIGSFLPIPRTVLLVGAGAVFGLGSVFIAVPSTTLGSLLAFLFSRYVFSKGFRRFLGKRPQLRLLEVIVGSNDWRIVAVMRLGVPIPSFLQNYMFGLTRLSVLPYALATFIFTIPQAVLFVVLGRTGREVLMTEEKSLVGFLPLVLAVASTLVLIVLIARHAKREYESLATEQMVKCE